MIKFFKYSIMLCIALMSFNSLWAVKKKTPVKKVVNLAKEINWLTVEEVEAKLKEKPKKVYIDVYTDWCGWCKVMDKKTFSHPEVVKYMNENFYSIHFNAEKTKLVNYMGKAYKTINGTSELASQWMNNQLSYPTSLLFDEDFKTPQPIPGYLDVPQFEMIVKYINENKHKSVPFEQYQKSFKPSWKQLIQ